MTTFVIAFVVLMLVVLGMSLGMIFMRKPIKGSCGGLNAIAGADHCVVCKRPVDPDSRLRDKFDCPRARANDA
ncbi:MAG: (Na+)-NQR maturation NqrM [Gammaproteobacteria bacterium]|nr:(Na+)-NQR maturation NqrM [Gammaproteobacteria bacterium]